MPKFVDIKAIESEKLEQIGFSWHKDGDGEYVVKDKLLCLSQEEALAYYDATEALYRMYEVGAEYVIAHELFDDLGIPPCLVENIKESWKHERDNHLYGRFDLSGGLDGESIKLIEFNADTPTLLLESAVIQWMLLQASALEKKEQFNSIYESISAQIKKIAKREKGEYSRFLFSCVKGIEEEKQTTKLLQEMAHHGGISSSFSYLEDISLNEKSVYDAHNNSYDFFFKLYPWEDMQDYTSELKTKILNPAFTLLYQSKGMLAILYQLFPDSPYLLKTSFEALDVKYVKKRVFGREGANIEIVSSDGEVLKKTEGIYSEYRAIYQEYVDFIKDDAGLFYQAGVFYSAKPCGVGFRRGAEILDDMSQFIGHCIRS